MNDLSEKELNQLLEYATESLYILKDEYSEGEIQVTKEEVLFLLNRFPEHLSKLEDLLLGFLLNDDFEDAKFYLQKALLLQSTNPVFLLYQALAYFITGEYQTAYKTAREIDFFTLVSRKEKNDVIIAFIPDEDFPIDFSSIIDFNSLKHNPDLRLVVQKICTNIQLYSFVSNYHRAIDCIFELFPLIDVPPELTCELGRAYLNTNQYEKAKNALRLAIRCHPKLSIAYDLLKYVHMRLKEYEEAIRIILKYIELEPTDHTSIVSLVVCLEELNQTDEAVEILMNVAEKCPHLVADCWRIIPQMDKLIGIMQEKREAQS